MNPDEFKTTGKQLFTIRESGLMDDYEVNVAIDFDFPGVKEKIKEMSMFWGGHPPETDPFEEHLDFLLRLIATDTFYLKTGEGLSAAVTTCATNSTRCRLKQAVFSNSN